VIGDRGIKKGDREIKIPLSPPSPYPLSYTKKQIGVGVAEQQKSPVNDWALRLN
jgi:hypothetical protein